MFNKGGKNIPWGKETLFYKCCWENLTATWKRMKLDYFLTPYTKMNSKWMEYTGRTLYVINHSKFLYDPPPTVEKKTDNQVGHN